MSEAFWLVLSQTIHAFSFYMYFAQLTDKVEGNFNKDVSLVDGGAKKDENKPKRQLDSKSK